MKKRVLMVCLGNICRSPLAEGILKSKVNPETVFVDSAGTAGYHIGKAPDTRSIAVAKKYGIVISDQKCRQFERSDFDSFDFIYAMDKSNYNNIIHLASTADDIAKVKLLLAASHGNDEEVPDPYYGANDGFETIYHLIDEACDKIAINL